MKQRFEDARVGDLVYCRLYGKGTIQHTSTYSNLIRVIFYNKDARIYCRSGKSMETDVEPTLFYRDDTSNYLEERPKRKVPWGKVPVDTKVLVSIHGSTLYKRYFSNYINTSSSPYRCFDAGSTSWSCLDSNFMLWDYCELAEEITIEGVTYYPGDN